MTGVDLKLAERFLDTKGMYSLTSDQVLVQNIKDMDNFINPLRVDDNDTTLNNSSVMVHSKDQVKNDESSVTLGETIGLAQPVMMMRPPEFTVASEQH